LCIFSSTTCGRDSLSKKAGSAVTKICKVVHEHKRNGGLAEGRQQNGGGVSFGFGLMKAQRAVESVAEKAGAMPR
jgi:hypothetical protein